MGQPTPPGDMPLVEGLGSEWNDIVSAFPEDRRAELAPKLKERISGYESLKGWENLQKSGITPDHADTALRIYSTLENNPREVYDTLAKYLNITPAQAQEVVEELDDADGDDPRIANLQKQVETLAQIALANKQMDTQQRQQAEADAQLESELSALKKKHGDFPEDEIVMRMMHMNMSADEAYQAYSSRVSEIQKRRPSPLVMGAGGSVPSKQVDVRKLDNAGTKNLVAQMLAHANQERNTP